MGDRDETPRAPGHLHAAQEAPHIADPTRLLDRADGVEWYAHPGSDVDLTAYVLCRLRRARAGEKGGPADGDDAVRQALAQARPPALVWLASRAISYMDESGFPEAVERWFPDDNED